MESDAERITAMGYRVFIGGDGGHWDEIGMLHLNFLKSEGLRAHHTLLDVACGSLRAGRLFINHLEAGNYLGIDKEIDLIIHGVANELGIATFVEKRPVFVVSGDFEFSKFSAQPDYVIAQSLFSHLIAEDIYLCFKSLRKIIANGGKFYATFFEVESPVENYLKSDAIDCFFYTQHQIITLAEIAGWNAHYIGDWGHPRNQKIVRFEPK
jgi:SAM-dependent methyltransferase